MGTAARYGVSRRFPVGAGELPVATLGANVLGAALLGLLLSILASRRLPSRRLRLLLGTGALGAFTTVSTVSTELLLLVWEDQAGLALVYAVTTLVAGVAAAFAGVRLGGRLSARVPPPTGAGPELVPREAPEG